MADRMTSEEVLADFRKSRAVLEALAVDRSLAEQVARAAAICADALAAGRKVLFAGNGGSAADAQHLAAELVSRFNYDRPGLAGIALTTDTSALTAIGNDYGYEYVFARQVEAVGRAGDIFVGISTSGRSPNVLRALEAARGAGLRTIGLCGRTGGSMKERCDIALCAPSDATPNIQEAHIVIGHVMCGLIERYIFPRTSR
jgi:D-sedoheptulose 7-phosphate isomerase